ncbi:MAG: hypothetical protein KDA31_10130 [Phycisphaerales bacterium]|nr:hypothetical protein [Phycisphaerales bacterium]MCB9836997.1 hypothetical protein [Phycisphaera sp.]
MPRAAFVAMWVGLALACPANAQWTDQHDPSIVVPPGIPLTEGRSNAALQYHMVWMLLEPMLEFREFTSDELEAFDRGELPEDYIRGLESDQEAIAELVAATKLERCDFGTQYEKGIGALLPQLAVMRKSARLLVNDSMRLRETDMDAVAERLAATIRLGEHASRGSVVIGSLVGVAITELARVEAVKLLEAGALNADQSGVINEALDRVLTDDPFHSLEAIRTEKAMMIAWIKNEYQGDDAGKRLAKILQYENNDSSIEHKQLRRMNGEQIAALTDETAAAYEDLIAAWQADDPTGEMRKIEHKLEQGEYGLVTKLLLPALGRFREKATESEQNLRRLRSELTAVQEG